MPHQHLRLLLGSPAVTAVVLPWEGHPVLGSGAAAPVDDPLDPPRVCYVIECQIAETGVLKGSETTQFVPQRRGAGDSCWPATRTSSVP